MNIPDYDFVAHGFPLNKISKPLSHALEKLAMDYSSYIELKPKKEIAEGYIRKKLNLTIIQWI